MHGNTGGDGNTGGGYTDIVISGPSLYVDVVTILMDQPIKLI